MREKQRFAIALGGVGGCLCIAAGIVITGPRDFVTPLVLGVHTPGPERLAPLPIPSWSDVAAAGPTSRAVVRVRAATLGSRRPVPLAVTASAGLAWQSDPLHALDFTNRPSSIVNRQSGVPLMLRNAPHASGTDVVVDAPGAHARGAVTATLVTAGTHIGEGFKTVGRTLKRVF